MDRSPVTGHIYIGCIILSSDITDGFSSQGHPQPFVDQKCAEIPKGFQFSRTIKNLWATLRRRFKVSRLPFCRKELAYWEIAQEANL